MWWQMKPPVQDSVWVVTALWRRKNIYQNCHYKQILLEYCLPKSLFSYKGFSVHSKYLTEPRQASGGFIWWKYTDFHKVCLVMLSILPKYRKYHEIRFSSRPNINKTSATMSTRAKRPKILTDVLLIYHSTTGYILWPDLLKNKLLTVEKLTRPWTTRTLRPHEIDKCRHVILWNSLVEWHLCTCALRGSIT